MQGLPSGYFILPIKPSAITWRERSSDAVTAGRCGLPRVETTSGRHIAKLMADPRNAADDFTAPSEVMWDHVGMDEARRD